MLNPFTLPAIPAFDPDNESWEVASLTVTHESGHTYLVCIGYDEPGVFGRDVAISVEMVDDSSINTHLVNIPNTEESIRKAIESCVSYLMSKL